MAGVRVQSVTKLFGDRRVVNNVSFEVRDGDLAAILGPSGSGKTTLLRCIAGLEQPDEGSVYLGDASVNELSPRERDVSMVFQSYSLFPLMSVRDNLAFPLVVRHTPRVQVEKRVKEVAEMLKIEEHLDKKPNQLSGGEQQRVSLGRAIVREPKAVLLDEPLSGLDAPLRLQLRGEIRRIQQETKLTMVYVTHDQVEGMGLANTLGVMKNGELIQYDKPAEVYAHPKSTFVAGFVGNPPASILAATINEKNGRIELSGDDFNYVPDQAIARILKERATRVFIGVRPEGVHLVNYNSSENVLRGVVDYIEDLGSIVVVHIKLGKSAISTSIHPGESPKAGQEVGLIWDSNELCFFDGQTEELLA